MFKSIVIILIFIFSCNFALAEVTDQEVEDVIKNLTQEQLDYIHGLMAEYDLTREDMIKLYKFQKETEGRQGQTVTLEEYLSKAAGEGASQSSEITGSSIKENDQTAVPDVLSEAGQTPSALADIDATNKTMVATLGLQEKPFISEPEKPGILSQGTLLLLLSILCVINFLLTLAMLLARKKDYYTIKT